VILLGLAALLVAATAAWLRGPTNVTSRYAAHVLARGERNAGDRNLVNPWGLAASSTGPWWIANEATETSTVYSSRGNRARLVVSVPGGPAAVVASNTGDFVVRRGRTSGPARLIFATEDGKLRAWAPWVPSPNGSSRVTEIGYDGGHRGTIFRGVALAVRRGKPLLFATDFHNQQIEVVDSHWRRVLRPGAFVDPDVSPWYGPSGILAAGGRIFVSYVYRAPVNGNDAPSGGYVDVFSLDGRLLGRVASNGALNQPTALALAPKGFGTFGGDLLVANFGTGHIAAYEQRDDGSWRFDGLLRGSDGEPLAINGLWGIAFGNDFAAGARDVLFYTAGPHRWRGATEIGVGGRFGSIALLR
jgi:uncharacterized protein (TIGR03118 family)